MAGDPFTPAEETALAYLLHEYGLDWKLHLRDYSVLDGRSPVSCEKHLWHTDYFGLGGSLKAAVAKLPQAQQGGWPEPDPENPLFLDDPRAEHDHGSPGFRF